MLRAEEIADEEVLLQVTTEGMVQGRAPHLSTMGPAAASNSTTNERRGRRTARWAEGKASKVPAAEDDEPVAVEGCEPHGQSHVEVEIDTEGYEDVAEDQGDCQLRHPERERERGRHMDGKGEGRVVTRDLRNEGRQIPGREERDDFEGLEGSTNQGDI